MHGALSWLSVKTDQEIVFFKPYQRIGRPFGKPWLLNELGIEAPILSSVSVIRSRAFARTFCKRVVFAFPILQRDFSSFLI